MMSKRAKFFFIFFFWGCILNVRCQVPATDSLCLKVIEEESGNPIENCTILHNGISLGVTDRYGKFYFCVKGLKKEILLKHISYESKMVDISSIPSNILIVPLSFNVNYIQDVVVSAKAQRIRYVKMGITKRKPRDEFFASFPISPISKMALFIPNTRKKDLLFIQDIYIHIANRGNPLTPFFVSIYEAEKEFLAPDDSKRIFGPLYTKADNEGYHKVSVAFDQVKMSKFGVFIVLEGASNLYFNELRDRNGKIIRRDDLCIYISDTWDQVNKFYRWRKNADNDWIRDTIVNKPSKGIVQIGNPMIYITLKEVKN